jgi:predicted permease
MFARIRSIIDSLVHGSRQRQELDEEMAFHMEELARDLMLQGMSPEEAHREARHRFGATEPVHERSRRARGVGSVDEAARNVRFALRSMRRSPVITGTFVLTLALCIGFGTAVFTAVDSILWKPLPFPNAERLALAGIYDASRGPLTGRTSVDGASWIQIRDEAEGFRAAVYSGWVKGVNLSADGAARFVQQQRVGAGFFSTLGVEPLMGREFTAAEDVPDGPPLVVLSHELWQDVFDADPAILGSTVRLKGELHTVVGVMPPGFRADAPADLWTPLRPSTSGEGSGTNFTALVRLPAGMAWEEAHARFAGIEVPMEGDGVADLRFGIVPLGDALSSGFRVPLLVLLGAVALMILVGCGNLAGIQVSRSLAREAELATRKALGSGVGALFRQLFTENLMLGLLGGAAGLVVAVFALDGLEVLFRSQLGTAAEMTLDRRALGVALGLTGLTTFLFGLTPLLQVGRSDALRVLVGGTRGVAGGGGRRVRKVLLIGEVAMVTVLLFAAVLLARSYGHLMGLEPGFDPEGVLTVQFSLDDVRYADGPTTLRLFEETVADLTEISGVSQAAVALSLPYERPLNSPFRLEGDDEGERPRLANVVYVTDAFFETLGIPVREGRTFDARDGAEAPPVAVANQALVNAHFEGRSGVGERVTFFGSPQPAEVVGVVGNVQQGGGGWGSSQPVWAAPTLYIPVSQAGGLLRQVHVWFSPSWVIRTTGSSPQIPAQVAQVFTARDSELPVARMASLEEVMNNAFAASRFQARFLLLVAAFALLLAGVGLYGIVAQEGVERRREMGVRMALGATPGRAIWTTGMAGVRLAAWGLVLGGLAAFASGRVLESLLWGVTPTDPLALLVLVSGVGGLALVASFVPALKLGRVDPARVLRE